MRRLTAVLLVGSLGVLSACNRGDDPNVGAAGPSGSTIPGSSIGPARTAPPDTIAGGALPISAPAVATRANLTDVRLGARTGGDRVVFQFDPVVPGYTIHVIQRPVTEDGSGEPVTVRGAAVLEVRMENASAARFEGEKVVLTYTGPKRVRQAGTAVVTEVVQVGDFEGVLSWVVGLRRPVSSVAVSALGEPSRLVLDIPAG